MCVCVRHTAFSDSVAGLLVAGFVLQVLGRCDLSLQEGAPLVQLLQRHLKTQKSIFEMYWLYYYYYQLVHFSR